MPMEDETSVSVSQYEKEDDTPTGETIKVVDDRLKIPLFKSIDGETWQEKLDTLIMCDCCERHKKDKPSIISPWKDTPLTRTRLSDHECHCDCRHLARFICRQFEIVDGECVLCDDPYGTMSSI